MKRYFIRIILFSIYIYILLNSINLYSYNGEKVGNKGGGIFQTLTLEEKKKIVREKIIRFNNRKKLERLKKLKQVGIFQTLTLEEKKKIVREKIIRFNNRKKLERLKKLKQVGIFQILTLEEKKKIVREKIIRFIMRKRLENKKKEEKINLLSAIEEVFPYNLDISSKLKYKSLQERSLSCELSVTSDIVSFFENKKVSETYIINLIDKSYYNMPFKIVNGIKIWGNPNKGYVGYINRLPTGKKSRQYNLTGYGVLEKPIDKIFHKFHYKTKIITKYNYNSNYTQKEHLTEILKTLKRGNMVQLWGDYCTDPIFEDTKNLNTCKYLNSKRKLKWYYEEDGKLIKYEGLSGEHAFYLLGYKGGVNNPTYIIVWDTKTGKHTYDIKEWLRKWNKMQNRSIIIYNKEKKLT